uniref:Uncharacterized protein n=1 Tax=Romanomermis culicivorax TaxID=13658 RepID=A0A915JUK1_ROMCU
MYCDPRMIHDSTCPEVKRMDWIIGIDVSWYDGDPERVRLVYLKMRGMLTTLSEKLKKYANFSHEFYEMGIYLAWARDVQTVKSYCYPLLHSGADPYAPILYSMPSEKALVMNSGERASGMVNLFKTLDHELRVKCSSTWWIRRNTARFIINKERKYEECVITFSTTAVRLFGNALDWKPLNLEFAQLLNWDSFVHLGITHVGIAHVGIAHLRCLMQRDPVVCYRSKEAIFGPRKCQMTQNAKNFTFFTLFHQYASPGLMSNYQPVFNYLKGWKADFKIATVNVAFVSVTSSNRENIFTSQKPHEQHNFPHFGNVFVNFLTELSDEEFVIDYIINCACHRHEECVDDVKKVTVCHFEVDVDEKGESMELCVKNITQEVIAPRMSVLGTNPISCQENP